MNRILPTLSVLGFLFFLIRCAPKQKEQASLNDPLKNNFKMGFKTGNRSTGPLMNTFFFFQLNDTLPPLMLTAHHVVAFHGNDYYRWDELDGKVPDAWLWNIYDSSVQLGLGKNLPVQHAKTMHLDLAAYRLPPTHAEVACLTGSATPAAVNDTVFLFSKLKNGKEYTTMTPGVVIYVADSLVIYEVQSDNLIHMGGTSGSPVLNGRHEVISNSFGGFTVPNVAEIENIARTFPLAKQLPLKVGKAYGIGLPVAMIKKSLVDALALEENEK